MSRQYHKQNIANHSTIATWKGSANHSARLNFINSGELKSRLRSLFGRLLYKKVKDDTPDAKAIANKLMFVFQGRNGNYKQMGQALYKSSHVFRESINRCHNACTGKFNFDLLRIFEDESFDFKTASELDIFIGLSCVQCALTDFYYSKKIIPEAIIAMSLGEAAAGYAAGAYSLKDAVSIAFFIFDTCAHMAEKCTLFMLNLSMADLARLIEESAGTLIQFAEFTSTKRVLICSNKNFDTVSELLRKNNISGPQLQYHGAYHTPYSIEVINASKADILGKFGSINYSPLKIPFHTCLYERAFSVGAKLNAEFWVDMLTNPVLFGRVITSAISNGFDVYLNIGGHPKLSADIEGCANDMNRRVTIFDSFRKDEPELQLINKTVKGLEALFISPHLTLQINSFNNNSPSGFMTPGFFRNPYPCYEVLRTKGAVQFLEEQNYWLVLDYADVDFALKNPHVFSSIPAKGLDAVLLGAEPVDHARVRKLVAPFFKNTSIAAFAGFIQTACETLIEAIKHRDFDVVTEYAIPLTEKVIAHLIGLNNEHFENLQQQIGADKYVLAYIPVLEDFFSGYLMKPENLVDSTFCAQLLSTDPEKGFTVNELASMLKLLWVAGSTTTSMLISSSILILLNQPHIQVQLRSDTSKIPLFVEEVLRVESPEQTSWRTTTDQVEISGLVIPANSEVRLCLASANRDPQVFESPNEFIPGRNAKKHLAFAAGPHYCLGAELARLEARIAIETLLNRCPALLLKTTGDKIDYLHSEHFRALTHLTAAIK